MRNCASEVCCWPHHPGMTGRTHLLVLAIARRRRLLHVTNLERFIMSAPASDRSSGLSESHPASTLTGPVQVFSSVPGAKVHLIWKRIEPVASDSVLVLTPTITLPGRLSATSTSSACPAQLGQGRRSPHRQHHQRRGARFLRRQAEGAEARDTSVCTSARQVLGAVRAWLKGHRAVRRIGSAMERLAASRARRGDQRRGCASTATASPAAASPRVSIFALTLVSMLSGTSTIGRSDPASPRI